MSCEACPRGGCALLPLSGQCAGTNMNPISEPTLVEVDRRGENRRPVQTKATLTLIDGEGAGTTHEILTRDIALSGICFLMNQSLAVGQNCRIDLVTPGGAQSHACEIVRARPVNNDRFELAVQFRAKV